MIARKTRFIRNLWPKGTIVDYSSQEPQFPALDTQEDTPQMFWRTKNLEKLTDGGLNEWDDATHLTHWTESIAGSSTVNREATEKIEGDYSCRLDIDASNNEAGFYEDFTLRPNTKYRINIFYLMSLAGKTAKFQIRDSGANVYLKSDGTWQAGVNWIDLTNSTVWKLYNLIFSAHASYSNYRFYLARNSAASSSIYFDKLSIEEIPHISLKTPDWKPAGKGTMNFDSGSVEPTIDEWLFDQESGAYGQVESYQKDSGDWGTGTAAGSVVLKKCEGRFHDNSKIDGSIGGVDMLTVNMPDTAAGVDKIRNGEYENGTGGWTASNATLSCVVGGKIGNCLMITENGGGSPIAYQDVTAVSDKIHEFKVYMKAGTEATYRVTIRDQDHANVIYQIQDEETVGDWNTNVKCAFKIPSGCTTIRIWLQAMCGAGSGLTMCFDEVSLYELDEEDTEAEADFISLRGHNFSPSAEIKLIGAMDEDFSKAVTEIDIPYYEENISWFFTKTLRLYWKVQIDDPENENNYRQLATPVLGKSEELDRIHVAPKRQGWDDPSKLAYTDSMALSVKEKPSLKTLYRIFEMLNSTSKDIIEKLNRECGLHKAFIVCLDYTNPNLYSFWMKLDEIIEPESQRNIEFYNWELIAKEVK